MDDELRERRRAQVVVAAVPQDEPRDVVEVRDREVGRERRLAPRALDADADVRRVDHADVVAAVADRGGALARVLPQQLTMTAFCVGEQRQTVTVGAAHDLDQQPRVVLDARLERRARRDEAQRVDGALRVAVELLPRLGERARHDGVRRLVARDEGGVLRDVVAVELVARQHPRAHVGAAQHLQRRPHVRLQAVLAAVTQTTDSPSSTSKAERTAAWRCVFAGERARRRRSPRTAPR